MIRIGVLLFKASVLSALGMSKRPLKTGKNEAIPIGTIKQIKEGINTYSLSFTADTLFAIQSIVVVTSPIGDQAPPALAAIISKEVYQNLVF